MATAAPGAVAAMQPWAWASPRGALGGSVPLPRLLGGAQPASVGSMLEALGTQRLAASPKESSLVVF